MGDRDYKDSKLYLNRKVGGELFRKQKRGQPPSLFLFNTLLTQLSNKFLYLYRVIKTIQIL